MKEPIAAVKLEFIDKGNGVSTETTGTNCPSGPAGLSTMSDPDKRAGGHLIPPGLSDEQRRRLLDYVYHCLAEK